MRYHVVIRSDPCRVNIDKLRIPLYCKVDKLTNLTIYL
jgi:hypothetical protein